MHKSSQDQKHSSLYIRTWNFQSWKQYVCQKNINYVSDYYSGLSRALLRFFPTTFLEIAVFILTFTAEGKRPPYDQSVKEMRQ